MKAELEAELERRILSGRIPRFAICDMLAQGIIESPKQAWRTLEKWAARGRYEYGVNLELGWLTDPETKQRRGVPLRWNEAG